MKEINIVIGMPVPDMVYPAFALNSLPAIISYTKDSLDNLGHIYSLYETGVRTDKNRNNILKQVLDKGNIDYILWLDADMIFPKDIIVKYLRAEADIIGCLYFKRTPPYAPVGYIKGDNPKRPYKPIDPFTMPREPFEVDGLGFGGMMVKTSVYEAMGDDKWMNYGKNFHLPFDTEDGLTHDLEFCKNAQKHGFKIMMHPKVKPTHLGLKEVSQADWEKENVKASDRITVIMPTTDVEMAKKASALMKRRAGVPCDVYVIQDVDRSGFIATANHAVRTHPSDYYVYTAQDAFVGNDWLKTALETMRETKAGLFAFNNGRWGGALAAFGMVSHEWMIGNYGGDLFYNGYKSHYADVELTVLAMDQGKYAYNPEAVMTEVDYEKDSKGTNLADKILFAKRKQSYFNGKVRNSELFELFS